LILPGANAVAEQAFSFTSGTNTDPALVIFEDSANQQHSLQTTITNSRCESHVEVAVDVVEVG
jgi:hypothetical protein